MKKIKLWFEECWVVVFEFIRQIVEKLRLLGKNSLKIDIIYIYIYIYIF